MITQSGLLCNHRVSVYRSRMDKADPEKFRLRLKEAIEDSPPSQTAIAHYCDVTVQSVGGWKKNGQISEENLKKLSEISGYRYKWLVEGKGRKRFTDPADNQKDMMAREEQALYGLGEMSGNAERLVESLKYALANNRITDESIGLLAEFLNSLVKNKNS